MSHIASNWAIEQRGISPIAKLVLMVLADYHNKEDGGCFPSVATLAEVCCCDERTVVRATNELLAANLLEKVTRKDAVGRQKSNQYNLNLKRAGEGDNLTPMGGTNLSPLEPVINNHSDITYRTDPMIDSSHQAETDYEAAFWIEATALAAAIGLPEKKSRPIIGKALKLNGGDRVALLKRLDEGVEFGAEDPVSWIMGGLSGKKKIARGDKQAAIAAAFKKLEEEDARIKAEWARGSTPDDGGESSTGDHVVLQPDPHSGPRDVPKQGGRSLAELPRLRSTKVMRPLNGHLVENKISAHDIGTGSGSAEHTRRKAPEPELRVDGFEF